MRENGGGGKDSWNGSDMRCDWQFSFLAFVTVLSSQLKYFGPR